MKPSRRQLNSKWVHLGYQSFILRTTVIFSIHHKFFTHIFIIIIMTIMDHIWWIDLILISSLSLSCSLTQLMAVEILASNNLPINRQQKKSFHMEHFTVRSKIKFLFEACQKKYKNNSALELRKWKTREELRDENHDHA